MRDIASQPIGIFDSGIGGLTVAHAVTSILPNERIVYFGDIAHLPYGDKSEAAIQAYSIKITDFLLQQGCKVILIACNSASSAAYELLKEYTASKAKVINVIDPMVNYVCSKFQDIAVGLIGTKRTVESNIYEKKITELGKQIALKSLATPLLVPIIEEGFFNNKISDEIIAKYLGIPQFESIKALILGCTHYPLIKRQIHDYYDGFSEVEVIDSSEIVAKYLRNYLEMSGLLNEGDTTKNHKFFVSDYTDSFESSAEIFFQEEVHLEKYRLWE